MTNAIKNSLTVNPSGQPSDGPMGISIALSPTTNTATISKGISKTATTNASFRTQKLPDDIPIVISTGNSNISQNTPLSAINEEGDESDKVVSVKTGLAKVSAQGIGKMAAQLLQRQEKKEKKKENTPKNKFKKENGEIIHKHLDDSLGNDFGSDTSGISDSKSSFSEETIPLAVIYPMKTNRFEGDNMSNSSGNSADVSVPLVKSESIQQVIKQNNNEAVNV